MSELNEKLATAWEGFTKGDWQNEVNVRDFIQKNYTPYEGDESFLAGATEATTTLWDKVMEGVKLENRTHAPVDFDTAVASTITSHDAGYINKALVWLYESFLYLRLNRPPNAPESVCYRYFGNVRELVFRSLC